MIKAGRKLRCMYTSNNVITDRQYFVDAEEGTQILPNKYKQ